MCWITDGNPPRGLLLPTGIEPTPSRNLVSKGAGLQAHITAPGYIWPREVLKLRETQST